VNCRNVDGIVLLCKSLEVRGPAVIREQRAFQARRHYCRRLRSSVDAKSRSRFDAVIEPIY